MSVKGNMNRNITYPLPMKILGIGRGLPKRIVTSEEIEEKYNIEKGWCINKQGISSRYWIEDETNTELGAAAAKEAIQKSGLEPNNIDFIINAGNTYDSMIPDQSVLYKKELGINNRAPFITVNSGCLNFINALDISSNLLATNKYKNILIITTVIASKGFIDYDNPNNVSMLADAVAAVVVTRTPENEKSCVNAVYSQTFGNDSDASSLNGDYTDKILFSKNITKEDFQFKFAPKKMQGAGARYNAGFLSKLYPMDKKNIDWIIPNQSTRLARDMMRLMFPKEKILSVIENYGNIGPVGYPLAMYHAVEDGKLKRGDVILMNGIGAGISLSGIVLTY